MHFGKSVKRLVLFTGLSVLALGSCKRNSDKAVYFLSPTQGGRVTIGESFLIKTDAEAGSFDSIRYFIDSVFIANRTDTQGVQYKPQSPPFGGRLLRALVYTGGDSSELTTNIQLLPSTAPINYTYEIVNVYPHDTTSFTEGLEYHDGILYESDGGYAGSELGGSSLRRTELKTGKVLKQIDLDSRYFAEGITVVDNKIIQLTWKEGVGFVYDRSTLEKLAEFPYTAGREGWGLAFDGRQILNTDGSNSIYFLNKDTYQKERTIEVYDTKGPVEMLNELEFIDGKIYANIWQTDSIAIINPESGLMEGLLDLAKILPAADRVDGITQDLNGIAWDAKGRRLFITGKKWNKLFEIKVVRAD